MIHPYVGIFGTLKNEEFLVTYENAYDIMLREQSRLKIV